MLCYDLAQRGKSNNKNINNPFQDAYVHVTLIKKWDICAGDAILRALGGQLTDLSGKTVYFSLNYVFLRIMIKKLAFKTGWLRGRGAQERGRRLGHHAPPQRVPGGAQRRGQTLIFFVLLVGLVDFHNTIHSWIWGHFLLFLPKLRYHTRFPYCDPFCTVHNNNIILMMINLLCHSERKKSISVIFSWHEC